MIKSKYINLIIAAAVIIALAAGLLLIYYTRQDTASGITQEYESQLFGGDIIKIEIEADPSEWQAMLKNARAEEYIMADVVVNGTRFQSVGIRPKGNSSLNQVAQSDSTERYSFRLKFDEYIEGQTCFGLDCFVLNNMMGDNSYMKEYLSYDIQNYIGVETPLYDFADINVNGEPWGFYLAVESYDDSYLSRVYGSTGGSLYNVKSMDMGDKKEEGMTAGMQRPEMSEGERPAFPAGGPGMPSGGERPARPDGMPGDVAMDPMADDSSSGGETTAGQAADNKNQTEDDGAAAGAASAAGALQGNRTGNFPGGRTTGGDLKYTDDDPDSYPAIFENAVGKTDEADCQRVITALKSLSTGTELEKYFDVDQILRYMAAHTVVVSLDSYSSNMAQNYYIYEKGGQITILPWDYNFSFGGFQSGSASSVVNFPVDTPVSGVTLEDRPLFAQLLANEEYKAKYHQYLQEIVDGYFADGKWEAKVSQLNSLITKYVKNDPSAFCTYAEYEKAVPALVKLGELRVQSIAGQLDGSIPSTTEEQNNNTAALIAADSLDLNDLGKGMGGDRGDNMGGQGRDNTAGETTAKNPSDNAGGTVPSAFGDSSGEAADQTLSNDADKAAGQNSGNNDGVAVRQNRTNTDGKTAESNQPSQDREDLAASESSVGSADSPSDIIITGGLLVVLILAAVFIARYKGKF